MGIGEKVGLCCVNNMEYGALYINPTTLLWADKVCLPEEFFRAAIKYPHNKFEVAIATILEKLHQNDMIELLDDDTLEMTAEPSKQIEKRMAKDMHSIFEAFPENAKQIAVQENNHLDISIDGLEYCEPYILSIYASLSLAKGLGAYCLFNNRAYTYLKYKLGLDYRRITQKAQTDIYDYIFSFVLPNDVRFPEYAIEADEKCNSCAKQERCSLDFITDTKKTVDKILEYRNYDELYILRQEIDGIIEKHSTYTSILSPEDVKEYLREKKQRVAHMMNRRFPQVRRWTKFATIASVPAALLSLSSDGGTAAAVSAVAGVLAKGVESTMDVYESRNKWVSFIDLPN